MQNLAELVPDAAADRPRLEVAVENVDRRGLQTTVRAAESRLTEPEQVLVNLLCAETGSDYSRTRRLIERPVGSIGPTRQPVIARLRNDPDIARLRQTEETGASR